MPRVPGCEAVYEVADQWRDRCLKKDGSLLWPNEVTWTSNNLDHLFRVFVDHPDEGSDSFPVKLKKQIGSESAPIQRIAADALAVYCLFPSKDSMGKAAKTSLVKTVAEWQAERPPLFDEITTAFEVGIGSPGQYYMNSGRPWQWAYIVHFASKVHAEPESLASPENLQTVADEAMTNSPGNTFAARNAILHLLFPNEFERIASRDHKSRIVETFGKSDDSKDPDEALRQIRKRLEDEIGRDDFDFYDPVIRLRWNPSTKPKLLPTVVAPPNETTPQTSCKSSLELLESKSFLTVPELREIESLTASKKQIIFEGPPGSGKTYVAKLFARYLAGLPLDGAPDEHVEIVQFHQSYGYEDFVAGIRPITNPDSGQLTYETRPGIFVEMCQRALAKPDETFVLIIDEINRGNLSRIFGELLYGLEYRDQPVRMQYPVSIDGIEEQHLTIPHNLYLIGTMNSTDRSLAMIDYALRRRFYFWRLMPVEGNDAPVLRRWLDTRSEIDPADRKRLLDAFIALNGSIVQLLGEDFQIGHSYFMVNDGQAGDPAAIEQIWRHAIEPLLREYFHTRHDAGTHIARMRALFFAPPAMPQAEYDEDIAES